NLDGANDLQITYNDSSIVILNQYDGNSSDAVEQIQFTGGGSYGGYKLGNSIYTLTTDSVTPLDGSNGLDVIASSATGETLNGSAGNDLLFGNAGSDTINGGVGSDLLVGGVGNDKFVFTVLSDSLPGTTSGIQNYDV